MGWRGLEWLGVACWTRYTTVSGVLNVPWSGTAAPPMGLRHTKYSIPRLACEQRYIQEFLADCIGAYAIVAAFLLDLNHIKTL